MAKVSVAKPPQVFGPCCITAPTANNPFDLLWWLSVSAKKPPDPRRKPPDPRCETSRSKLGYFRPRFMLSSSLWSVGIPRSILMHATKPPGPRRKASRFMMRNLPVHGANLLVRVTKPPSRCKAPVHVPKPLSSRWSTCSQWFVHFHPCYKASRPTVSPRPRQRLSFQSPFQLACPRQALEKQGA